MNVENILKVADAIEQHTIADLGFNMGLWAARSSRSFPDRSGHNCGTVACIGGWTDRVIGTEGSAADRLGLDYEEADALFCPPGWSGGEISQLQAVAVLRHLAATGKVDWTVGAPEPSHA